MHSPADVLCGACIGAAAAAFSYCRSFGKGALHFPVREYSEYPARSTPFGTHSPSRRPTGALQRGSHACCNAVATLVATQRNRSHSRSLGECAVDPVDSCPVQHGIPRSTPGSHLEYPEYSRK